MCSNRQRAVAAAVNVASYCAGERRYDPIVRKSKNQGRIHYSFPQAPEEASALPPPKRKELKKIAEVRAHYRRPGKGPCHYHGLIIVLLSWAAKK